MKIIDAHIHFAPGELGFDELARQAGHENTVAHLEAEYGRLGIAGGVVMGNRTLEPHLHEYPAFLRYCVGLDSHCFWKENQDKALVLTEEHLRREECVGIKLYPGYCKYYLSDPVYRPYYELAKSYRKPVAVHTGATAGGMGLLKYSHPLTLDEVASAYPGVQFVMCHFGNPWMVDAAAVMGNNKNVVADLSGLLEGMVDIERFFQENEDYVRYLRTWMRYTGGYDRFLFGTDWPLANLQGYIEFVARIVPSQHHEAVFFHNANRVYALGLQ